VTVSAVGAPAAIEVDGLTKRFGGRAVVDDLSFSVAAGETFALLGPNGAGKTTTVEIIEGYRRPDGGTVRVLGVDPANAGPDHRARVGLMLQGGGGVDPRMSAREVLRLHGSFHAAPRDADELLELVGLIEAARTRFRRLSGGERQRLGLALALVGRPALVALDEPTAGMDVEGRAATRALIGRLRSEGVTVLLTSHDLTDVEKLADRIAIIDRGRLVALGAPSELASTASPHLRFRLSRPLDAAELADLTRSLGARVEPDGTGYEVVGTVVTSSLVTGLARWSEAHGILIAELRTGSATLEERYLELVGGVSRPT
jgi:ABC-2 type transport system ATP-binding protein